MFRKRKQARNLLKTLETYQPNCESTEAINLGLVLGFIMMNVRSFATQSEIDKAQRCAESYFVNFDQQYFDQGWELSNSDEFDGYTEFEEDKERYREISGELDPHEKLTIIIYLIHIGSVDRGFENEQLDFLNDVIDLFDVRNDRRVKNIINQVESTWPKKPMVLPYDPTKEVEISPSSIRVMLENLEQRLWGKTGVLRKFVAYLFIALTVIILGPIILWVILFILPISLLFWPLLAIPFITYPMANHKMVYY